MNIGDALEQKVNVISQNVSTVEEVRINMTFCLAQMKFFTHLIGGSIFRHPKDS